MNLGEILYYNIPTIKQAVNRELWIQKWTQGLSTQYLVNHYIRKRYRTPLLEWNAREKSCILRIGLCLFECSCISKHHNKTNVLILQKSGEWKPTQLCEQCMVLFV